MPDIIYTRISFIVVHDTLIVKIVIYTYVHTINILKPFELQAISCNLLFLLPVEWEYA